jgi:hypothetical protein
MLPHTELDQRKTHMKHLSCKCMHMQGGGLEDSLHSKHPNETIPGTSLGCTDSRRTVLLRGVSLA